jgi:hypothetical protein
VRFAWKNVRPEVYIRDRPADVVFGKAEAEYKVTDVSLSRVTRYEDGKNDHEKPYTRMAFPKTKQIRHDEYAKLGRPNMTHA